MTPVVSIIIPTYNRAHLIGETLDSVIAQTYQNWECIVVDDGSKDYTNELLEFYCEKDPRIYFYHRPSNRRKGANACRNYGFELSKGQYIQWFDSDDCLDKDKLSLQLYILNQDDDLDFCTSEYGIYSENLKRKKVSMSFTSKNLLIDYLVGKAFFNLQTSLFRRVSISQLKLDESLSKAQEMEFFIRYLSFTGLNYYVLHKELVKVRSHSNNISHAFILKNRKAIKSEMKVRLRALKVIRNLGDSNDLKLALNIYFKILKSILTDRLFKLYFRFVFLLFKALPFYYFIRITKLALIGNLFLLTGKGLHFFRFSFRYKIKIS